MSVLKIGTILLMLPLRPLTEANWFALVAIIAIIVLIIYLTYSYVFRQKTKAKHQVKEEKNEANKARK